MKQIETTSPVAQTENPVSGNTSFTFTLKPWKQPEDEYGRFEKLAQKLVNTPKPNTDK